MSFIKIENRNIHLELSILPPKYYNQKKKKIEEKRETTNQNNKRLLQGALCVAHFRRLKHSSLSSSFRMCVLSIVTLRGSITVNTVLYHSHLAICLFCNLQRIKFIFRRNTIQNIQMGTISSVQSSNLHCTMQSRYLVRFFS